MTKDKIPILHSRPFFAAEETEAVNRVLRSGHVAMGQEVHAFEKDFGHRFGFPAAVATSSGTAALHLSLIALGVGAEDEVIIPSFVCTALLNAVKYTGARPVLADIEPETLNIDPEDVARCVTDRTRAIIVPHMFGLPAALERLTALGIPIVEDCAQAIGARLQNRNVGTLADVAIFSFYATKMMTTAEGGMIVSRHSALIDDIRDRVSYDNKAQFRLRYNYKMTDIGAAMGRIQLNRLDHFVRTRNEIAAGYDSALQGTHIDPPPASSGRVYFRYVLQTETTPERLIDRFDRRHGIQCARPVFLPLHRLLELDPDRFPNSENAFQGSISIPLYPALTTDEIQRIVFALGQELNDQ